MHAKAVVRHDMAHLGVMLPRLALSRNLRCEKGSYSECEGTHCEVVGAGAGASVNRWHTLAFGVWRGGLDGTTSSMK